MKIRQFQLSFLLPSPLSINDYSCLDHMLLRLMEFNFLRDCKNSLYYFPPFHILFTLEKHCNLVYKTGYRNQISIKSYRM